MIEVGKIYRFIYQGRDNSQQPHNIVYGLVNIISGDNIFIVPLNGFLGDQHLYYNVMNRRQKLIHNKKLNKASRIISYQTSNKLYKQFVPFSHQIIKHILDNG